MDRLGLNFAYSLKIDYDQFLCEKCLNRSISIVLFTYIIVHISLKLHLGGHIMLLFNTSTISRPKKL